MKPPKARRSFQHDERVGVSYSFHIFREPSDTRVFNLKHLMPLCQLVIMDRSLSYSQLLLINSNTFIRKGLGHPIKMSPLGIYDSHVEIIEHTQRNGGDGPFA